MTVFFAASRKQLRAGVAVCVCFCILAIGAVVLDNQSAYVYAKTNQFHVVIDAGHGGKDGGAESPSGTKESDINLKISKYLAKEFSARGVAVTLTRKNSDSLASPAARNKKLDDMKKRKAVIEKACPDLVVSIHLNNFPADRSVRGLQCFYSKGSEVSKTYADSVQTEVNSHTQTKDRRAMAGDYYILECTAFPSILVECGFLSNTSEEKMLKTDEYQKILAYYIATGIIKTQIAVTDT